jgi:hypothetical protein
MTPYALRLLARHENPPLDGTWQEKGHPKSRVRILSDNNAEILVLLQNNMAKGVDKRMFLEKWQKVA